MASLKEFMYKRAAMQNGPGPKPTAKPAYTPKDSVDFVNLTKRYDKTVKKGDELRELESRQNDSMFNSNYFKGKAKKKGNTQTLKDKNGSTYTKTTR